MSLVPLGSPMHVNPWTVLLMLDSRILGWQACLCRPSGISWWVCHLTISSLTHSLPVFLDFGSVSPGLLLADCGWTAMSLFLTCHWFLAVFCRAKTSCARILVSQMFFQHLVTCGVHLSLFIQRLVMDILFRFLAPLVLSSPCLAVLIQLFVNRV